MQTVEVDFGEFLYNSLPFIYRQEDEKLGFPLKRFCSILGGPMNEVYEQITKFSELNDPDRCPADYLPYKAASLGLYYPPDMPESDMRQLLKIWIPLCKMKGREEGIVFLIKLFTQADVQITPQVRKVFRLSDQSSRLVGNRGYSTWNDEGCYLIGAKRGLKVVQVLVDTTPELLGLKSHHMQYMIDMVFPVRLIPWVVLELKPA